MNAHELLAKWPTWEKADAGAIFDSPAWMMPVRWGESSAVLRRADLKERDVIGIAVRFDGEENFVGIGNWEAFPDLHALWSEKRQLPDALLLALVEKECGRLFQILENAARRQLSVVGLAPAEKREGATGFELVDGDGNLLVSFVMKVTPELIRSMGMLKFINVNHPSVRDMTREAMVEYFSFGLPEEQLNGIAAGDYLLLPEITTEKPSWVTTPPVDNRVHVFGCQSTPISFAQFAAEDYPPFPEPSQLTLMCRGRLIANGRLDKLVSQPAFVVEEVL